uniref:Uncharacterized protein n=1 Tax=Vespula pensylvanica TaxID=30213 RepID=A0A834NWJ0_VESPE|nr:hypothetical protein H0235_010165 [Vespula pensylvanica]
MQRISKAKVLETNSKILEANASNAVTADAEESSVRRSFEQSQSRVIEDYNSIEALGVQQSVSHCVKEEKEDEDEDEDEDEEEEEDEDEDEDEDDEEEDEEDEEGWTVEGRLAVVVRLGLDWIGLDWIGLGWVGLTWLGLNCVGLGWIWLGSIGLGWVDLGWVDLGWVGLS